MIQDIIIAEYETIQEKEKLFIEQFGKEMLEKMKWLIEERYGDIFEKMGVTIRYEQKEWYMYYTGSSGTSRNKKHPWDGYTVTVEIVLLKDGMPVKDLTDTKSTWGDWIPWKEFIFYANLFYVTWRRFKHIYQIRVSKNFNELLEEIEFFLPEIKKSIRLEERADRLS